MRTALLQEELENTVKKVERITGELLEAEIWYLEVLKEMGFEQLSRDEKVNVAQILILLFDKFGEERADVVVLRSYFEPKFEAENADIRREKILGQVFGSMKKE